MDKYTIEQDSHFEEYWSVLKNDKYHCEFVHEKDAQDYIAWKNQPKIDVDIKQSIINSLIAKRELRYKTKFTTVTKDLDIQIIDEAIEILSSLPTEEN